MKVSYIGNFIPEHSTENDVRKAFEFLGHQVIEMQENTFDIFAERQKILESDMLLITSTWDEAIPLALWLTLMKECAERGIPTVTLHLDTFWGKSRGGRNWWLNPMFHTAYICTADGDYQKEWIGFGKNHIWLPPAVRHDAVFKGNFNVQYACDVAFVGSNGQGYHEDVWSYRKELVDNLRDMCKQNNWSFKNPGGDDPKIDRNGDLNDFYASAKVVVGDSLCLKKEASHYWSDRVPETLGRGGNLIMPQIDELSRFYENNLKMYQWGNYQQLEDIIKDELAKYSKTDRSDACYDITKKEHTYVNRAKEIIEMVTP